MYNIQYIKIKDGIKMNEKIVEKLKDSKFLEKIIVMSDKNEVKEAFKKEGIEITDEDLKNIRDLIAGSVEKISEIPEEKLEEISGGNRDGIVDWLDEKIYYATDKDFFGDNSGTIAETILATAVVGGTIGVQKLIKMGKEKGWWTKKYWEDTLEDLKKLKNLKITISTK